MPMSQRMSLVTSLRKISAMEDQACLRNLLFGVFWFRNLICSCKFQCFCFLGCLLCLEFFLISGYCFFWVGVVVKFCWFVWFMFFGLLFVQLSCVSMCFYLFRLLWLVLDQLFFGVFDSVWSFFMGLLTFALPGARYVWPSFAVVQIKTCA